MSDTSAPARCDICGLPLPEHGFYVLRMELFAEPSLPQVSAAELASTDYQRQMQALIDQMSAMTAEDLQDQVYRRFHFRICSSCQPRFLVNPLGLPRSRRTTEN